MRALAKLVLLALLLAMLIGNARAIGCDSLPSSQVTAPANAIGLAFLALILSFFVVAIAYIVGGIVPGTGIRNWIQVEWLEIAKTALLIGGIYAVLAFMGGVAASISYAQSPPAQTYSGPGLFYLVVGACNYLTTFGFGGPSSYLNQAFSYILGLANWLGFFKSITFGLFLPIPLIVVTFNIGATAQIYNNRMLESFTPGQQYVSILSDSVKFIASPVALLFSVQSAMLPALFGLGIAVFIPIGLFFRAFPFMRGIGGTLVAIGIGLSLIYPSLLLLFNYPVSIMLQGVAYQPTQFNCPFGIFCGIINAIVGGGAGLQAAGDAFNSFTTIFPALNGLLHYTVFLNFQLILFIADFIIGFPIANEIARLLGGSIRLSLGRKIKLI